MNCTCRASVHHQPGCPDYPWMARDDEERTILAHYRGDCHNSADCPACKAGFNYQERIGTQADKIGTLQRRLDQMGSSSTLNREIDRLEQEERRLRQSLASANNTSAHRLRERQEAERQRDAAYAARDRALDDMQEVITGSREPESRGWDGR